jgi:hypothetical protein
LENKIRDRDEKWGVHPLNKAVSGHHILKGFEFQKHGHRSRDVFLVALLPQAFFYNMFQIAWAVFPALVMYYSAHHH